MTKMEINEELKNESSVKNATDLETLARICVLIRNGICLSNIVNEKYAQHQSDRLTDECGNNGKVTVKSQWTPAQQNSSSDLAKMEAQNSSKNFTLENQSHKVLDKKEILHRIRTKILEKRKKRAALNNLDVNFLWRPW